LTLPKTNSPARTTILAHILICILFSQITGFTAINTLHPPENAPQTICVFIDCIDAECDFDFFRTEIPFVNYVRDPKDSDLHILITTMHTGSGGEEYTISFLGQKQFAGKDDTLRYVSHQDDSEDDVRKGLTQYIKLGMMRYIASLPVVNDINISMVSNGEKPANTRVIHDPWNFWTFRNHLHGTTNGEKSIKSMNIHDELSANRITEAWKMRFSLNVRYSQSKYQVEEDSATTTITNIQRNSGLSQLTVKSVNDHWSIGTRSSASISTFDNLDLAFRIAPAVEYDLFPYSQATRRQFTVQYSLGVRHFDYHEITLYGKNKETFMDHHLDLGYEVKQPWGSISTAMEYVSFVHDPLKYHMFLYGSCEIRLLKGLFLDIYGSIAYLRDQISLPRRDASFDEVLLQRRQLETSYDYYLSIGLNYTFGSIYNNIVNPRFDGVGD
jgi:hypothetical protein